MELKASFADQVSDAREAGHQVGPRFRLRFHFFLGLFLLLLLPSSCPLVAIYVPQLAHARLWRLAGRKFDWNDAKAAHVVSVILEAQTACFECTVLKILQVTVPGNNMK